jgi:hypothetical protein
LLQNASDKAILKQKPNSNKYENLFVVSGQYYSSSEDVYSAIMDTAADTREHIEMVLEAETPEMMEEWIRVIHVNTLSSLQKMDSSQFTCAGLIRERAGAVQAARDATVIVPSGRRRGSFLSKLIPMKEAVKKSAGTKAHKKMVKRRRSLRLEEEPKVEDNSERDLHVEDGSVKTEGEGEGEGEDGN